TRAHGDARAALSPRGAGPLGRGAIPRAARRLLGRRDLEGRRWRRAAAPRRPPREAGGPVFSRDRAQVLRGLARVAPLPRAGGGGARARRASRGRRDAAKAGRQYAFLWVKPHLTVSHRIFTSRPTDQFSM